MVRVGIACHLLQVARNKFNVTHIHHVFAESNSSRRSFLWSEVVNQMMPLSNRVSSFLVVDNDFGKKGASCKHLTINGMSLTE